MKIKEKWFKVSWYEWTGNSYVKAANKEKAIIKAEDNQDVNYEDESDCYERATHPVKIEDAEEIKYLEEMLRRAKLKGEIK